MARARTMLADGCNCSRVRIARHAAGPTRYSLNADAKPEMMENCPGLVARGMPRAIPARRCNPIEVRITTSGTRPS